MKWLSYPYYEVIDPGWVAVPQPGGKTTEMASNEYSLSESVSQAARGFRNFFNPAAGAQYLSPANFRAALIEEAKTLTTFTYSHLLMPDGWDPIEAGTRYANILINVLKQIPVNQNDPDNSNNAYDAWIDGTGMFYDGWGPGGKKGS